MDSAEYANNIGRVPSRALIAGAYASESSIGLQEVKPSRKQVSWLSKGSRGPGSYSADITTTQIEFHILWVRQTCEFGTSRGEVLREAPRVQRVLDFLRTAPHERANRSPETKQKMLSLIGAAGPGLPSDLSYNLDKYLYGSRA